MVDLMDEQMLVASLEGLSEILEPGYLEATKDSLEVTL